MQRRDGCSDVMDAEVSMREKPSDVCDIVYVMKAEGSLNQKSDDVYIMGNAESIELGRGSNV